MTVPSQTKLHRLLLETAVKTGQVLSTKQFIEQIASRLSLTQEDLNERSSSGGSEDEYQYSLCIVPTDQSRAVGPTIAWA